MRLGDTEFGPVIALRAAVVIRKDNAQRVLLLRSGPLLLEKKQKIATLHGLGQAMGQPDYYVRLNEQGIPQEPKHGAADDDGTLCHRLRAFWERQAQLIAVEAVRDGVVLIDGNLNSRGRDTPVSFWRKLGRSAGGKGCALIGISKDSELDVLDRNVRWWLDDHRGPGFRDLMPLLRHERRESSMPTDRHRDRSLGNIFAVRFAEHGPNASSRCSPGARPVSRRGAGDAPGKLPNGVRVSRSARSGTCTHILAPRSCGCSPGAGTP